jgi:hypothetical protein
MSARRVCTPMLLTAAWLLAACGGGASTSASSSAGATPPTASTATTAAQTTQTTTATPATTPAGGQRLGPEGMPLEPGQALAPASSTTQGGTVDGIQCAPVEQLVYHIHAHLQVYVNGQPRQLPAAIGLVGPVGQQTAYGPFYGAQQCYYWLHTHTTEGVIHVESPGARVYTLGNFFDEWRQPLSRTQVAGVKGKVTAFFNGKPWTQDPRAIPLVPRASIQLDVGSPVVGAQVISWAGTSL